MVLFSEELCALIDVFCSKIEHREFDFKTSINEIAQALIMGASIG